MDEIDPREIETRRLRDRSGNITAHSALQSFFYDLLRDHIVPGAIEKLVLSATIEPRAIDYTNGWLAQYAGDLANRLLEKERANLIATAMTAYVHFRRAREQIPEYHEQDHFKNIITMLVNGEFPK